MEGTLTHLFLPKTILRQKSVKMSKCYHEMLRFGAILSPNFEKYFYKVLAHPLFNDDRRLQQNLNVVVLLMIHVKRWSKKLVWSVCSREVLVYRRKRLHWTERAGYLGVCGVIQKQIGMFIYRKPRVLFRQEPINS